MRKILVVIPIQTISFYNMLAWVIAIPSNKSCHTYPNDKLLQPEDNTGANCMMCCHTYPNDKLLQHVESL